MEHSQLSKLYAQIKEDFNLSELKDLCFHLGVPYDELQGEGKNDKVRELINYLKRRKKLDLLVEKCVELRPNSYWKFELESDDLVDRNEINERSLSEGEIYKSNLVRKTIKKKTLRYFTQRRIYPVFIILSVTLAVISGYYFLDRYQVGQRGWRVRAFRNDDIDAILVNQQIVGVTYRRTNSGWINIDNYLTNDNNTISLVHLNGSGPGDWEFEIRHNSILKWHDSGQTTLTYTTTLVRNLNINENGDIYELELPDSIDENRHGKWEVLFEAEDFGLLLVNGFVAAGTYKSGFGEFSSQDISKFITNGENKFEMLIWSSSGLYTYDINISRDGSILWKRANRNHSLTLTTNPGQVEKICIIINENSLVTNC